MSFRDLKLRLRALVRPAQVERDLLDEISFHIEREAMKLIDQGMPPEEARATGAGTFRIDNRCCRRMPRRARNRVRRQHAP